MFWLPGSRPLLKLWAANFKTTIGPIATRINQPAADVAKAQANMDKLQAAIDAAMLAKQEWQRLVAVADDVIAEVGDGTRLFVNQLKVNPLLTENDKALLQIISTTPIADVSDYQPELTIRETGGTIHIGFKKHGADGMNIYYRLQGQAAFTLLANAKRAPYVFMPAPLAEGASQVYDFCATPTLNNTEAGHRSEIVSYKISK